MNFLVYFEDNEKLETIIMTERNAIMKISMYMGSTLIFRSKCWERCSYNELSLTAQRQRFTRLGDDHDVDHDSHNDDVRV